MPTFGFFMFLSGSLFVPVAELRTLNPESPEPTEHPIPQYPARSEMTAPASPPVKVEIAGVVFIRRTPASFPFRWIMPSGSL